MMKASGFEFRHRFWILLAIYALGLVAPWDYWLHMDGAGPNTHVWGRLAIELSRAGMDISVAFRLVLIAGIVLAFAGAGLRTWATANLGPEVMRGGELRGASLPTSLRDVGHPALVVTGPYRYVRNPLYIGLWLNGLALALLMPPSGAIFLLVLLIVFQLRLILAEEAWLGERLGAAYAEYGARVGRVVPRMRGAVAVHPTSQNRDPFDSASPRSGQVVGHPSSGVGARWGRAALAEIFLWGTAVSYAAVGWQYNAHLLMQCVVVSLGAMLVVRGVVR